MPTLKKRVSFFESEEGIEVKKALLLMASDKAYNTEACYSANTVQHPDNLMSFVDKHLQYLNAHPALDPYKYLANLRLITRKR